MQTDKHGWDIGLLDKVMDFRRDDLRNKMDSLNHIMVRRNLLLQLKDGKPLSAGKILQQVEFFCH